SSGTTTVNSIDCREKFTLSGGILTVKDTVQNVPGTVQIDGLFTLSGGTLAQATVAAGTTLTAVAGDYTGAFEGNLTRATLNGALNVTKASVVVSGLTVNGTVNLNGDIYSPGYLQFSGQDTLSGSGTITLNNDGVALWVTAGTAQNPNTLTLGPQLKVHGWG